MQEKKRAFLIIVTLVIIVLLGYIDYLTGFELRIDVFYLLPVALAVWYVSSTFGSVMSLLSAAIIFIADLFSKTDHHIHLIDLWNIVMILLFFVIFTVSLSKLRIAMKAQKKLSLDLQRALDERNKANEYLESFSYSVSHDLKSPLWHIASFASMLLEKHADRFDDEGKDYVGRILSNASRMNDLIDALLALSKYSRHALIRSEVDLTALVRMSLEENVKTQSERKVEFVTADGVTAYGDPALLQVVISNLVDNAWKFTRQRPITKLEFGSITMQGEDVYFIRDNGVGFSPEDAARLFHSFQQLHSAGEFSGFGIGLATVKRIIDRHGGRIWAESQVNNGTTFFFTLAGHTSTALMKGE